MLYSLRKELNYFGALLASCQISFKSLCCDLSLSGHLLQALNEPLSASHLDKSVCKDANIFKCAYKKNKLDFSQNC